MEVQAVAAPLHDLLSKRATRTSWRGPKRPVWRVWLRSSWSDFRRTGSRAPRISHLPFSRTNSYLLFSHHKTWLEQVRQRLSLREEILKRPLQTVCLVFDTDPELQ